MRPFLIMIAGVLFNTCAYSQRPNWQNLDLEHDSVFGISTEKAYNELLKNRKWTPVIVAVIDNGVDTAHEDLQGVIWSNTAEKPGNKQDDDHNGFTDDLHGWNFLGSEMGVEDVTDLARAHKFFYDSLSYSIVPTVHREGYQAYRKMWKEYVNHVENAQRFLLNAMFSARVIDSIIERIGKKDPGLEDFRSYAPLSEAQRSMRDIIVHRLPSYPDFPAFKKHEINDPIDAIKFHIAHGLNWEYDPTSNEKYQSGSCYGNNDVNGPCTLLGDFPGPEHGTHIAGIIAGVRENGIGIKGVADHTSIMPLRVMSFYRELRDYDLANAIRYAVVNGAKVINLSFGKPYTRDKTAIDDAVKFAMDHDVLIVHAAGNEGKNTVVDKVYPSAVYEGGNQYAKAWLEVGASGYKDDSTLAADFSNYGKTTVDVFAPGFQIKSCIPNSKYQSFDGTSMAAPVVAGLAALIREYFPKLTAVQVKEIIMKSVVKIDHAVNIKIDGESKQVSFSDLCVSGGIINAYKAVQLAEKY